MRLKKAAMDPNQPMIAVLPKDHRAWEATIGEAHYLFWEHGSAGFTPQQTTGVYQGIITPVEDGKFAVRVRVIGGRGRLALEAWGIPAVDQAITITENFLLNQGVPLPPRKAKQNKKGAADHAENAAT